MSTESKYLGLGFLIGGSVAAGLALVLFLFAPLIARPAPAPTAEVAPTASSTDTPASIVETSSATASLTPGPTSPPSSEASQTPELLWTSTPDAVADAILAGGLIFSGPLADTEQISLYRASLPYVQSTIQDSKRLAKQINGVGYGDPDNICGPLAIAILRDAGLIPLDTVPHDFWLLDPTKVPDQRKLAAVFPPEQYAHTKIDTALNKVDWHSSPLEPGDFLFIWHGSWGNFDHMLVVNRVDSSHRAYAVTNFGTPQGFIIAETMLYDPNDPSAGIFHTWTQARDQILGSTGFGGYEIWRRLHD